MYICAQLKHTWSNIKHCFQAALDSATEQPQTQLLQTPQKLSKVICSRPLILVSKVFSERRSVFGNISYLGSHNFLPKIRYFLQAVKPCKLMDGVVVPAKATTTLQKKTSSMVRKHGGNFPSLPPSPAHFDPPIDFEERGH